MPCGVHRLLFLVLFEALWLVVATLLVQSPVIAGGRPSVKEEASWSELGRPGRWFRLFFVEPKMLADHEILRYGNWYGPKWWGGAYNTKRPGDKPPVDSLDMVAMKHDMAWNLAEEQGGIHGKEEEARLKAIADYWAVCDAKKLDEHPGKWPFPPKDIAKTREYWDRIIVAFEGFTIPIYHPTMSAPDRLDKWAFLSKEEYEKQRKTYYSTRLTVARYAELVDKKVADWIQEKEGKIENDIEKDKENLTKELSPLSEKVRAMCEQLFEEKRRVDHLLKELEELATKSDAMYQQMVAASLHCEGLATSVENAICSVKGNIQHEHEKIKQAIADGRVLLETCDSKKDAEEVTQAYDKAKGLLAEINKLWEKSSGQRAKVKECEKEIAEVCASRASIPQIETDMLAKMAAVRKAKETFSRERLALLDKENEALETACESWGARVAELKWSARFTARLEPELKRYCKKICDVEQLNDEFETALREAYAARDVVRRVRVAFDTDEQLTRCADYSLQAIEDTKQIKAEAEAAISGASDIPEKVAQCEETARRASGLTKVPTKHYVAYALGPADGTGGEITISDAEEMNRWKSRGAWVTRIPEIASSADYQTVYDSACAYIRQHEQGIPVGEPGKKAWGIRGQGVHISGRWCRALGLECSEKEPAPQVQGAQQSAGTPAGAVAEPVAGAKEAKVEGAVDLRAREGLGGAVTPWTQPAKEIRDVPAPQVERNVWAQPRKELKEVPLDTRGPVDSAKVKTLEKTGTSGGSEAIEEPMLSKELLKEWEDFRRSTDQTMAEIERYVQEAYEQMRQEQAVQEAIEREMQLRRDQKSREKMRQCQALYHYASKYVGREPLLAYRAMEHARLYGCPRFPDTLIDAILRNAHAAQERFLPPPQPTPQPPPEQQGDRLLGEKPEFHF